MTFPPIFIANQDQTVREEGIISAKACAKSKQFFLIL